MCLKLIIIVILWVYKKNVLHHLFQLQLGWALFGHHISIFLSYFVWLRITDEVLVPKIQMLIKSELNWSIHLSISLFIVFYILNKQYREVRSNEYDLQWFLK